MGLPYCIGKVRGDSSSLIHGEHSWHVKVVGEKLDGFDNAGVGGVWVYCFVLATVVVHVGGIYQAFSPFAAQYLCLLGPLKMTVSQPDGARGVRLKSKAPWSWW